jgi:hypothetical protein
MACLPLPLPPSDGMATQLACPSWRRLSYMSYVYLPWTLPPGNGMATAAALWQWHGYTACLPLPLPLAMARLHALPLPLSPGNSTAT